MKARGGTVNSKALINPSMFMKDQTHKTVGET